jgi:hypothetical protein
MKNFSIRTLALTAATVALLGLAESSPVSADPAFSVHIGSQGPPPDRQDYKQWQRPYHIQRSGSPAITNGRTDNMSGLVAITVTLLIDTAIG